jgi:hypothetical protein
MPSRRIERRKAATPASAKQTVRDSSQNRLHFLNTGIGVEQFERGSAIESAIGLLEPSGCVFACGENVCAEGEDASKPDRSIRFLSRESGLRVETAAERALRYSNSSRDRAPIHGETFGKFRESGSRNAFSCESDKLRRSGDLSLESLTAAHHGDNCFNGHHATLD